MTTQEKPPRSVGETLSRLLTNLPTLLDGFEILSIEEQRRISGSTKLDALVEIRLGRTRKRLVLEVKSIGEPRAAMKAIVRLKQCSSAIPDSYPVFAAPYISQSARRLCKLENVGYIDLAGSLYLRFGSVLVDRSAESPFKGEPRGVKQLLAPKATRVLRALLMAPKEPARITDLAASCEMSPAGVYWVVRLLEDEGYVQRDLQRRVILVRPKELLDMWAGAWNLRKNSFSMFFSLAKPPEKLVKNIAEFGIREKIDHAFTLMAGASLVAPFVRYETVWLYVAGDEEPWAKGLDLRLVEGQGNVVLVRPYDRGVFQGLQVVEGVRIVSDIQLYVDLYNYAARGREQAEFLRERKIGF